MTPRRPREPRPSLPPTRPAASETQKLVLRVRRSPAPSPVLLLSERQTGLPPPLPNPRPAFCPPGGAGAALGPGPQALRTAAAPRPPALASPPLHPPCLRPSPGLVVLPAFSVELPPSSQPRVAAAGLVSSSRADLGAPALCVLELTAGSSRWLAVSPRAVCSRPGVWGLASIAHSRGVSEWASWRRCARLWRRSAMPQGGSPGGRVGSSFRPVNAGLP